jgi:hypothetical protein
VISGNDLFSNSAAASSIIPINTPTTIVPAPINIPNASDEFEMAEIIITIVIIAVSARVIIPVIFRDFDKDDVLVGIFSPMKLKKEAVKQPL